MSYRELRNLTEMMRSLGFPRLISVENFRTPNFALVAEILSWMVERYDPDIAISDIIDTETDRVEFLTSICQNLASKAHLKLNAKRLYSADGYAVKELLKLATLLYSASKVQAAIEAGDEGEELDSSPLNAQLQNIKEARTLAGEITDKGAKLYDLLGNEAPVRKARMKALAFLDAISGNLDSTAEHKYIEKSIRDIINKVQDNMSSLTKQVEDLQADERSLDQKIKKKTADLERGEKRLKSLQTVRPAFMDEYEKLEKELQRYYETYMEKFRNLDYLEHELDKYNKAEQEKLKEANRQIQQISKNLLQQERDIFVHGGQEGIGENDVNHLLSSMKPNRGGPQNQDGLGRKYGGNNGKPNGRGQMPGSYEVEGSMDMEDESSDSSDGGADDVSQDDVSSGSDSVSMNSEVSGSDQDLIEDDDGSEMSDQNGYVDGGDYSGSDDSNF
mmetsp:Transcript_40394/g.53173  ORF Transcript_40394/g.53173 Transcript_40394/m.53173 type:complete len:446 (-) Transcript_40394:285-1622(-)